MTTPIIVKPSPNFSLRPAGLAIDLLVLHADASENEHGTVSWIQSPKSRVSYHYLIGRTGLVYQFVGTDKKAWHAGESSWKGRVNCNAYSIGVSFANRNDGIERYPEEQLRAGLDVVSGILLKHPAITLSRIVGHYDVSPRRKTDPRGFPMQAFIGRLADVMGGNVRV